MLKRWLAALVGVPALLGLCWWGPRPFAVTVTLLAGAAAWELMAAQRRSGLRPTAPIALLGLFGPALPLIFPHGVRASSIPLAPLGGLVLAVFVSGLIYEVAAAQRDDKVRAGSNVGAGLLCAAYIALFGGISLLRTPRNFDAVLPLEGADPGFFLVLLVLCCIWATDTAAYYVGVGMGAKRLAPTLSPNKTVEGAVGGFVVAVMVGAVLGHFLLGRALLGWWIGATAGVAGQIGDLFESALKRELGVKDTGAIIPGHGGVLDRFDSLLFVAPVVWLLVQLVG